jgi:hypothetical protein
MTSVIRRLADAELDIATNAVVINKDESDFMKRLLEGDRKERNVREGLLLREICTTFVMVPHIPCLQYVKN